MHRMVEIIVRGRARQMTGETLSFLSSFSVPAPSRFRSALFHTPGCLSATRAAREIANGSRAVLRAGTGGMDDGEPPIAPRRVREEAHARKASSRHARGMSLTLRRRYSLIHLWSVRRRTTERPGGIEYRAPVTTYLARSARCLACQRSVCARPTSE